MNYWIIFTIFAFLHGYVEEVSTISNEEWVQRNPFRGLGDCIQMSVVRSFFSEEYSQSSMFRGVHSEETSGGEGGGGAVYAHTLKI